MSSGGRRQDVDIRIGINDQRFVEQIAKLKELTARLATVSSIGRVRTPESEALAQPTSFRGPGGRFIKGSERLREPFQAAREEAIREAILKGLQDEQDAQARRVQSILRGVRKAERQEKINQAVLNRQFQQSGAGETELLGRTGQSNLMKIFGDAGERAANFEQANAALTGVRQQEANQGEKSLAAGERLFKSTEAAAAAREKIAQTELAAANKALNAVQARGQKEQQVSEQMRKRQEDAQRVRNQIFPAELVRGPRGGFLGFTDKLDKAATSLLGRITGAKEEDVEGAGVAGGVSAAAQLFLSLGGALSPISPLLGRMILQVGFAGFSLKSFGIVLGVIGIGIGTVIAGVKKWANATKQFVLQARAAGEFTAGSADAFNQLGNSIREFGQRIGKVSAASLAGSAESLRKLVDTLASSGGVFEAVQTNFLTMASGFISAVSISSNVVLKEVGRWERTFSVFEAILRRQTGPLGDFFLTIGKTANAQTEAAAASDFFLSSLQGLERNLVFSGDAVTKFAQKEVSRIQTREQKLATGARNRAQAAISGELTVTQAVKAQALARKDLFKNSFQPSIIGLEAAASGIVKERRDETIATQMELNQALREMTPHLVELGTRLGNETGIPVVIVGGSTPGKFQ